MSLLCFSEDWDELDFLVVYVVFVCSYWCEGIL